MRLNKISNGPNHHSFYSTSIKTISDYSIPFKNRPFVCLLWVNINMSFEQRVYLASLILESGCVFSTSGGKDADTWEGSFDEARNKLRNNNLFIMTVSYQNSTEEESAYYFVHCTEIENIDIKKYLFIYIGEDDEQMKRIEGFIKKAVNTIEN